MVVVRVCDKKKKEKKKKAARTAKTARFAPADELVGLMIDTVSKLSGVHVISIPV